MSLLGLHHRLNRSFKRTEHRIAHEAHRCGKNMDEKQMYIDGQWCASSDNNTHNVLNPATGETIATTPKATLDDVNRCVAASKAAFADKSWSAMDPAERGRMLNRMAQATYANAKALAAIESSNNGKTFVKYCLKSAMEHGPSNTSRVLATRSKDQQSQFLVTDSTTHFDNLWGYSTHCSMELPSPTRTSIDRTCSCGRMHRHRQASIMDATLSSHGWKPCMKQSRTTRKRCSSHYRIWWTHWRRPRWPSRHWWNRSHWRRTNRTSSYGKSQ